MKIPATQRVIEAFERQNSFARAALGLAALLEKFQTVVERHGPVVADAAAIDPPSERTEPLLDALLGCMVLAQHLSAVFEQLPAPAADSGEGPPTTIALRELLR
jgi:hypothetical protein